jgi:hypothetical protein
MRLLLVRNTHSSVNLSSLSSGTGLIAFRIYSHDRQMSIHLGSARKNSLIPIMNIVLESGAINAAYLLAYIVVLNSGSHGLEIMAGIVGAYSANPVLLLTHCSKSQRHWSVSSSQSSSSGQSPSETLTISV